MTDVPTTAREKKQTRRLRLVLLIVTLFCGGELVGATLSRSAVLRADALHLLLDVFALALSLGAMRLANKAPTATYTFGFRRAEALAAVLNGFLVLGVAAEIIRDGIEAFSGTEKPDSGLMLLVALVALVVNGASAWLLHGAIGHGGHAHHGHAHAAHAHAAHDHAAHDHGHDHAQGHDHAHAHDHGPEHPRGHDHAHDDEGHALNLRGALLHLVGDALGAVAAVIAAVVIRYDGPTIIDPIASVFVALILLVGAVRLLRDAARVLLEGAPSSIDTDAVRALLAGLAGVREVTDVRVWTLGGGHDAIAASLVPETAQPALAQEAHRELKRAFCVKHAYVQVEPPAA